MKLRVRGNSVRLRLSPGEVERLGQSGAVAESTTFGPGQRFAYELRTSDDADRVSAAFAGPLLTVTLPTDLAREWGGSDAVSIRGEQALPEGGVLKLLIEKDFECLDARDDEEPAEAYPHPARGTGGACLPSRD